MTAAALGLLAATAVTVVTGLAPSPPRIDARGGPRRAPGLHLPALSRRDVAAGAFAAGVLGLLTPPLALVGVLAPVLHRHRQARRAGRAHVRAIAAALPEAVDLLLLCAGAGLTLPLAHPVVAERAPDPVGGALVDAATAADRGAVRADALLAALVPLGDRAAALGHVLVDHLRYGVPLGPGLDRLGLELRLDRRRRAEEEARRVPLRLLAPLLCCVLPAFGLLTVVPLLVATLQALPR